MTDYLHSGAHDMQGEAHDMLSGTEKVENAGLSLDIQRPKQKLWEKSEGAELDKLISEHAAVNA
eukprot:10582078-Karenia_brevis.AAC.1